MTLLHWCYLLPKLLFIGLFVTRCFSTSYAAKFLVNGLGLPSDKRLTIQKYVEDSEIEWALGAAYKEASDFLRKYNLRSQ